MGDLIPVEEIANVPAKYSDDVFDDLASSFLPQLRLMTASSDVCKSGEFPINHYALIRGSNREDLGTEVDVWVLDRFWNRQDSRSSST